MLKFNVRLFFVAIIFMSTTMVVKAQEGVVQIEQNKEIDQLLEFKKDLSTVNAYIIQVYNGSRSGAEAAKVQVATLYPEWSNSIEYEQPNYKIWVGNFRTRLEADRALMTVKKNYAHAFILQPKSNK